MRATVFNETWSNTAFANNITNKHAELAVLPPLSIPIPSYYRISTNQPLTAGMDLSVKF